MSKKSKVVAWGWLALCFIAMIVFIGLGKNYLDSDIASELIVGQICAQENVIMTKSWYYATEIRLLNMNLPMTLFFKFTSDYAAVRVLSSIVMLGLTVSSFLYCAKQTGLKSGIFFASLMILPFSDVIFEYELLGLFYCVYIIVTFYSIGWVMAINNKEVSKGKKTVIWVLYGVISLLMGMTTIRTLLTFYYPFVLACFVLWLMDYLDTYGVKVISFGEIWSQIVLKWKNNKYTCYLLTAGIGAFIASVGYVANVVFLRDIYDFSSFDRTIYTNVDDFARFSEVILGHARIFGYEVGCQFISIEGILNILVLLFTVLLIAIVYNMVKNNKVYELRRRVMILYFACTVLFNDFVFIFSDKCGDRYMIPYVYTFLIILGIFVERKDIHISVRKLFYGAFMGLFVLGSVVRFGEGIVNEKDQSRNEVADFLVERNYNFAYASFWNANVFTELTNGLTEFRNVNILSWDELTVEPWMIKKSNVDRRSEDRIAAIISQEEYMANTDLKMFTNDFLVFENDEYKVFEYYNTDDILTLKGQRVKPENEGEAK